MNEIVADQIKHPISLMSREFQQNKRAYYRWLREEAPVYQGKIALVKFFFLSRYQDCVGILKDPRFIRNRTNATGGRRSPFPLPKSIALLAESMITEDGDQHRRLRDLVHKAFTPRRIDELARRIETLTHELLDEVQPDDVVDLIPAYAHPIPVTVIAEMVGVSKDEVPRLAGYVDTLSSGFSSWKLLKTLTWDLPQAVKYCRELIRRKRADPKDDILTGLIEASQDGDRLSEDELVSMVFLLIMAGHETTVHLITNGVQSLLEFPDQMERLKAEPALMESAVEEMIRYNGPVHGTKPMYGIEDVTMHGCKIPKGTAVMPLIGAGNFDETAFDSPEMFDIARKPNRHLGFGHGIHYCLGAPLARMETRIAISTLLERFPNLELAVAQNELQLQRLPGWHRYRSLPVRLG